jgi:OOP family OmpA-OmpF porin
MKTIARTALATLMLAALMPVGARADSRNQGYLVDINGTIVMTDHTGMCVRDSDWTPSRAVEPCVPAQPRVAMAPPAAAAAPVVAVAPATVLPPPVQKPLNQKISFSADALFAFDKATLKPEGMAMLDDLVQKSSGATYESIVATGHADRIGSDAYNQKLSERRAQAVKDYLVGKNIQAGSIAAAGKGETQPVTLAGACVGPQNAKLIACLQPDRRVDVEMTGSRAIATGSR